MATVKSRQYAIYLCGPSDCPNDPEFEHDNYFGCVPKDFKQATGRSKTHRQTKGGERFYWDGGCDQLDPNSYWAVGGRR